MEQYYCYNCMAPLESQAAHCAACGFDNARRGNSFGYLTESILKDQYLIGRTLGQGGFGITYLGRDLTLDRVVAIKEYFPRGLVSRREDGAVIPYADCVQEFESGKRHAIREANAGISIGAVDHVVRVYNAFQANNTVYIVMDYVDGETLASFVKNKRHLTFDEATMLLTPVFHALEQIHAKDMVHRDISPENIMISGADGRPVILDFGAARSTEAPGSMSGNVCRPSYSPLEQTTMDGTQLTAPDKRSDEYSLCATFYYAITGVQPPSAAARVLSDTLLPPGECGSDIPHASEKALMKGMSIKIDQRYPDLAALEGELFDGTRPTEQLRGEDRNKKPFVSGKKKRKNVPLMLLFIIALALVGGGGILYRYCRGSEQKADKTIAAVSQAGDSEPAQTPVPSSGSSFADTKSGDNTVNHLELTTVFGSYEQDNDTSNGKEDIEWIVLDKDGTNLLLISRYALECQQYNSERTNVTWESSSLRKWLNETFLSTAFSPEEAAKIVTTTVTADRNPEYGISAGNDTQDKVFLLSITEAEKYFSTESDCTCEVTAYAKAQGADTSAVNGNCRWWLRSPGYLGHFAAFVHSDGTVSCVGSSANSGGVCVRPALWINLGNTIEGKCQIPRPDLK